MTNQELLEIINLAKKYNIRVNDLKMLLKLFTNDDGNINEQQLSDLEFIITKGFLDDKELKIILEKLLKQGYANWHLLGYLLYYPYLKKYLLEKDFSNEVWDVIFYNLRNMPRDYAFEKLYCEKLELYCVNSKEEIKFFGEFFDEIEKYSFAFTTWIWDYFFDQQKPLSERKTIFFIILRLKPEFSIIEILPKVKNAIKCYELYGSRLATIYAIALNKIDLEVPVITTEEEKGVFKSLYDTLCFSFFANNIANNFINSFYYKTLTDKTVIAKRRLEFAENLKEKELVLKDNIVIQLWNIYLAQGLDAMVTVKYAFLNNGIRTNILCKTFLEQETDIEVLELAREVFKINRVRKDAENLCVLNNLQTSEEKIEFLQFLKNKYPDVNVETKQQFEKEMEERQAQEKNMQESYNAFLNKKTGLKKLMDSLESSKNLEVTLKRIRVKNERN